MVFEQQRWPNGIVCPYCNHSGKVYRIEKGKRYKCNPECYKKFSVTVGTIYESTKIPLVKWFGAICICPVQTTSTLISTTTSIQTVVPQLLQTEWDQVAPYNNNYGGSQCGARYDHCGTSVNSNYWAGCVEVAEAQVIAYYYGKNPSKYGADWPVITNMDQACYLNANQINMVCSGTFAFPIPDNGISSTFGLVQGQWRSYNNRDLEAS